MEISNRQIIERKLIHIQNRPTYYIINSIIILLKNLGYEDIPKIQELQYYSISKESIDHFCNEVILLINKELINDDLKTRKINYSKEIFMFPESSFLPKNVYVSEKDTEDKLEDNFIDNIDSVSDSDNSDIVGKEEQYEEEEEGYQLYEEDNNSDFSR